MWTLFQHPEITSVYLTVHLVCMRDGGEALKFTAFAHRQLHGASSFQFLWLYDTLIKDSMHYCSMAELQIGQVVGMEGGKKESRGHNIIKFQKCGHYRLHSQLYISLSPAALNHTR